MFSFFKKHRKLFLTIALVAGGVLIGTHQALAGWDPMTTATAAVGTIVKWYVQAIGKLALLMIIILIKVAGYNEFVSSEAVAQGWVIVRDVVNMFFIVILLVIAFATIFNVEKYKYQAMLPRLLIMAVVINFSRTICGILIDFGQVVMLTFVNGFQAAAGGNFVNALRINDLLTFQPNVEAKEAELGYVFAAYILAALIITITLVVLVVMVIMLIVRIVTLWFLVVLSPIAFLASVWPSGRLKGNYDKWWEMFLDNIMVGPILAFFLWLSLLVLGSGKIGSGFLGSDTSADLPKAAPTQIGTFENMVSYLMGVGMLLCSLAMAQGLRGVGAGYANAILSKTKKYATAGLREAVVLPSRGVKKLAGAAYERTGIRANVSALGTVIQTSKFGKAVGLGTKEYKDMEKAKREEKALRRFGRTAEADTIKERIVASEMKKREEGGVTGSEIKAQLDSGKFKKGTYEYEATARLAASKGQIINSSEFRKYAGDDRKLEETLRTAAFKAGNKDAFRGWVVDPKKAYNKKKEAEDTYYKKSRGERQAAYSNIDKKAELDENGKVAGEFAAVDLSVIDPEDFANFSEKIQKGILDAIVLSEKNSSDEFKEFGLAHKFDDLTAKVKPGSAFAGQTFAPYSAAHGKDLFDRQAKSVAEKRVEAERAGMLERSDISKAAVQTFKNVRGQEGAGTGLDQGREWQENTLERTYNIQNDISVMANATDAKDIEKKLNDYITRLARKAENMDAKGLKTGQIDKATGLELSNKQVFLQSDVYKNVTAARNLARTGSADQKTKDAMAASMNVVARDMEAVAPRTATMSARATTRKAVNRYREAQGRAGRSFDNAKAATDTQKRLAAVKLAIKKAKDTTATITQAKKQFSQGILSEVDAINTELDALLAMGAGASNGDLESAQKRLEELLKKLA